LFYVFVVVGWRPLCIKMLKKLFNKDSEKVCHWVNGIVCNYLYTRVHEIVTQDIQHTEMSLTRLRHSFSWTLLYFLVRIIIGSDRRPETEQGIEGKIVRFRSGRVRDRVRVRDNWSPIWTRSPIWSYQFWCLLNSDRRSEPNTVLLVIRSPQETLLYLAVLRDALCVIMCNSYRRHQDQFGHMGHLTMLQLRHRKLR